MKLVFASIFAAATARSMYRPNRNPSILDLKPYNLEQRPTDAKIVEPASWLEEVQAEIGQECAVNPFILNILLDKALAETEADSSITHDRTKIVMSSLRKCKDNDAVKHIFTMEYLMKTKPDLYDNLYKKDANGNNLEDTNGENYLADFLELNKPDPATGKRKSFKKNLSDWSKSKVAINMMKWKYYNDIFNTMSLQKYQFWKRKANDLKTHRDAAKDHYKDKTYTVKKEGEPDVIVPFTSSEKKMMVLRDYAPFLPLYKKRPSPVPAQPIYQAQPFYPARPIIPAEPMPVAVSVEEQTGGEEPVYVINKTFE